MAAEVVWSAAALADLDRFAEFLRDEHPRMSREIAAALKARARVLADHPQIGRALSASPVYRRLFVQACMRSTPWTIGSQAIVSSSFA